MSEKNQAKYALKFAKKTWKKNIPNIIDRNLDHDYHILIIFNVRIFDTVGY